MATPNRAEHVEGTQRIMLTWSPSSVRAALLNLQRGDFRLAGSLADAVLGDDRAQSVIGTRVKGILGLPFKMAPAEDTPRAANLAEVALEDWYEYAPENVLAEWYTYALLCGACPAELVWDTNGARALPRIKVWHPSTLRYKDGKQWQVQTADGTYLDINPGDGQWSLLTPFGKRRPGTAALIRPLAIAWLSKVFAVGDWNRYSEIYGSPIRAGVAPIGATTEERDEFVADLRTLASDASVVLPAGWDMKLVEAKVGSGEVFDKLIDWAEKAMAVAVLGQNLTTDVSGGSYAAALVHNKVRQDILDSDVQVLSTTQHNEVIEWWAEYNFAARDIAPWPEWDAKPPEDEQGTATAWNQKAEALSKLATVAQMTGIPFDWQAIAETLHVPLIEGRQMPEVLPARPAPEAPLALPSATHRLASGDEGPDARAFLRGQLWIDDAAEHMAGEAVVATADMLRRVTEIVATSESYDEVRRRLISEYESLDVEAMQELTESAVTLAILSGRYAVAGEVGDA